MSRQADRNKVFSRRATLLAGGKLLLFTALAGRMYYLQVIEREKFATLAEENRISLRLLAPPRGRILDRFGVPLAINQENYRMLLVPEQASDIEATLEAASEIIPLSDHEKTKILREAKRRRSFMPVTVRENLTWNDVARVELNAADLPGCMIDVGQSRFYPKADRFSHVLGYVSVVSEQDLTGDPLLELPGFRIGKAGVERVHDLALRGKGGNTQLEVNALGRVIRELARNEGQPGAEVRLTIDATLQDFAYQRLGEQSASCVVMDVHSGQVLVMASAPGYDPNAFAQGLNAEQWKDLIQHPRTPLLNKCIAGQYAPGSTFKMMVALAALEHNVVSPDFNVHCSGHVELGNSVFHCWKKEGHGYVDMLRGIMHSCDVYFYEISKRVGIDRIADMAKRFGLGNTLDIDLAGEKPGLVPNREWKQRNLRSAWSQGETLVAGIGQGYMLTTPLQLAAMTARIANGGIAVRPRLTYEVATGHESAPLPTPTYPSIQINKANLAIVRKGMRMVVNEPGGTALGSRLPNPDWIMCGKTGTAQVRRITMRERDTGVKKNDELPWKERDHALFVAYAPDDDPKYAIAVIVEHGGGGSAVAAPIARDVMMETLRRDPVSDGARDRFAYSAEKDRAG
ncbi:putative cell division protein FtsI/penicillin-binding protein 2 [Rhodospirillaceae bacterium LM-1]|nr:putative cell division protein FtsI/penicillin-binding protein 2 [Rhodospirillaceae bacterium LM-1]